MVVGYDGWTDLLDLQSARMSERAKPEPTARRTLPRWAMAIILLGTVVLFYWKLTLTNQFTWLEDPDSANQVLPWLQFQAIQWQGFRIPAWDPNAWTGQPLFGQGQPGSAYPFNWLLFLMPMSKGAISGTALNWYFVLIRYFAVLGCYALCRDLKCSRAASILGACLFGLGGFVATTGWPQMVNGAVWAPLVFLFLFRVERGEHRLANSLLCGFFLGFAWLSGHHQAPLFITLATVAVWIWMALREGRLDRGAFLDSRVLRLAALSLAVAVMTSAFQTFPMAEYGSRSVRWIGPSDPLPFDAATPYYVHEQNALKPSGLLSVFLPVPSLWNPFIGIAGLSFATLGAMLAWREKHVRWLVALAVGGLIFALGPNGLLQGVLYSLVPMLEKARSPGAAIIVFSLGVSPLAAFGLDCLAGMNETGDATRHSAWPAHAARVLAGFGAILALASIFFFGAGFFAVGVNPSNFINSMLISATAAMSAAALITASRADALPARVFAFAAILLVLFELSSATTFGMAQRGPNSQGTPLLNNLTKHNDIAQFLLDRRDHGRIEYLYTDIPYNFGDWFGLETFQSYTASVTANVWQHQIFKPEVRDIFGIRYSIAKQPARPDQRPVFAGASGLNVYENPSAYPRVWAVHESMQVPDSKMATATLGSVEFDARKKVFFIGPRAGATLTPCGDASADTVALPLHGTNRVTINASLACPGMVILSDTFYPGWRATVDGKSAAIEEADGIFRGVKVPAGDHVIDMKYRPVSVIGGAVLSLLAGVIAAAAFFRSRS